MLIWVKKEQGIRICRHFLVWCTIQILSYIQSRSVLVSEMNTRSRPKVRAVMEKDTRIHLHFQNSLFTIPLHRNIAQRSSDLGVMVQPIM